jgi:N-acetylglucosaminyldiphosphoundecaprenol N-acetyl-beta-D-mannosaminyltransferase
MREGYAQLHRIVHADMENVEILGVPVHNVDMEGALESIRAFVEEGSPHLVVTLGTEMIMAARRNPSFASLVRKAHLVVPDTAGVVWAARTSGVPMKERVAGFDLLLRLAPRAVERKWSLYLLGAGEGVADKAAGALTQQFPGLQIAGCRNGYFSDDGEVIEDIRSKAPHILLVALGSPRQEQWFWDNREKLGVPVGIGLGGSFDVLAGDLRRAPVWMRRLCLEWMYRLLQEPRRIGRMTALPHFMILHLLSLLTRPPKA